MRNIEAIGSSRREERPVAELYDPWERMFAGHYKSAELARPKHAATLEEQIVSNWIANVAL